MPEPGSMILAAMYQNKRDEAQRLAAEAAALTVWEAAALGADDRLAALLDGDGSLANAFAPDGHTPAGLAAFFAPPRRPNCCSNGARRSRRRRAMT